MKKIVSLLCATLLVLSTHASILLHASPAPHAGKAKAELVKKQRSADFQTLKAQLWQTHSAQGMQRKPALVENGVITVDEALGLYMGSFFANQGSDGAEGVWEIDFNYQGNEVLGIMLFCPDKFHICGSYNLDVEDELVDMLGGFLNVTDETDTEIIDGRFDITWNNEIDGYDFVLTAICSDGNTYTMDYSCQEEEFWAIDYMDLIMGDMTPMVLRDRPAPETIEMDIKGYASLGYYADGDYQAIGVGERYMIAVDWFPKEDGSPLGSYTDPYDFNLEFSSVVDCETFMEYTLSEIKLEVTQANDTIYMEVDALAEDGNKYHALLKNYANLVAKSVVEITNFDRIESDVYTDALTDFGAIEIFGASPDYVVDLIVFVDENVVGNYTEADVYQLNYTGGGSFFGDMSIGMQVSVATCNISIEETEEGSYKASCSLLCANEVQYNFAVGGDFLYEAIKNPHIDAEKAQKKVRNGQLIIQRNGVEYNALGTSIH